MIEQESTSTFWSGEGVVCPEVFRLEKKERWYYRLPEVKFYTSATTWQSKVMPTPYFLVNWYKENTAQYVNEKLHMSSNFGTLEHILMSLLLREGSIDIGALNTAVDVYWQLNNIKEAKLIDELATQKQWVERLQNDLLCIVRFIRERNFKAHAIEWIGCYDGGELSPMKFAGAVDLVGEIDFNKGRKTVIIDLKTGNIPETAPYQLISYMLMWNQWNPEKMIDNVFNLSPKTCTSKSAYDLKHWKFEDYTDNYFNYSQVASRVVKQEPSSIAKFEGMLSRESNIDDFILSAENYVKKKHDIS